MTPGIPGQTPYSRHTTTMAVETTSTKPVAVDTGLISGLQKPNGTRSFLGVPYAAPPVGDLRWRPPQSLSSWKGVRAADKFGASSFQLPPPPQSLYSGGETEFSEDCLYLNIYTGPETEETDAKRPVLVWLHFGAFLFGSGSNPIYDGSHLAAAGATVVVPNYRLGRFGFLAHSELSAESGNQASGNYGIMDQIAVLQWISRNIAAFGGDPGNVTVGGASAGGASCHILRASPLARGLFHKVVCESAPGLTPMLEGSGPGHVGAYSSLAAGESAGEEVMQALGCVSMAELRGLSPEKILRVQLPRAKGAWTSDLWPGSSSLSIFDTANPVVDGHVLLESPLTALAAKKFLDVPMLAGVAANESSGLPSLSTLEDYHSHVHAQFPGREEEVLRLYPASNDAEAKLASWELLGDHVFVWSTWTAGRLQARALQEPAFFYKVARSPPIPADSDLLEKKFAGAFHGAGILYAFGTLDSRASWPWTAEDRSLSKTMQQALLHFMQTGDPVHRKAEAWPALGPSNGSLIRVWDSISSVTDPGARFSQKMAFWDNYFDMDISEEPA